MPPNDELDVRCWHKASIYAVGKFVCNWGYSGLEADMGVIQATTAIDSAVD